MTVLRDAGLREAAAVMADELAAALTVPPPVDYGDDYRPDSPRWRDQSLSKGAAGVAVLHGLRAQCGLSGEEAMHAWLARATRDNLSAGPGAGLWFGAPAVAFAISTAAPGRYPGAMASLDAAVADLTENRLKTALARMDAERRPALYEFDLVRGLTGLGAYLLHRDPGGDLVRRVLSYLVRLTHPVRAGDAAGLSAPGWWTAEIPAKEDDPAFAAGQADFGAAHGIAGPLSLMSIAMRDGVTVDGHREAIEIICRWLGSWRQHAPAGMWWPERITLAELRDGRPHRDGPARPSWCYGTPALARAQQLAALSIGDTTWQQAAEDALLRCLDDPIQLARITDPALCHGWAGVLATAWHVAADAAAPTLAHRLPGLLGALLDHAREIPPEALPGLVEGSAGIALTLHTIATGQAGGWQTCLLLD
ncbi:lanthionine synthetase C family protein [Streptomyces sp. NPDC058239]|uniref:lanthionine synthetase C family protein n=1 Tax=Streptomyces sp. NPDC058239 TaxID=3346395 RepID=UPI0036EF59C4